MTTFRGIVGTLLVFLGVLMGFVALTTLSLGAGLVGMALAAAGFWIGDLENFVARSPVRR